MKTATQVHDIIKKTNRHYQGFLTTEHTKIWKTVYTIKPLMYIVFYVEKRSINHYKIQIEIPGFVEFIYLSYWSRQKATYEQALNHAIRYDSGSALRQISLQLTKQAENIANRVNQDHNIASAPTLNEELDRYSYESHHHSQLESSNYDNLIGSELRHMQEPIILRNTCPSIERFLPSFFNMFRSLYARDIITQLTSALVASPPRDQTFIRDLTEDELNLNIRIAIKANKLSPEIEESTSKDYLNFDTLAVTQKTLYLRGYDYENDSEAYKEAFKIANRNTVKAYSNLSLSIVENKKKSRYNK